MASPDTWLRFEKMSEKQLEAVIEVLRLSPYQDVLDVARAVLLRKQAFPMKTLIVDYGEKPQKREDT